MKKILSLVFATLLLFACIAFAAAAEKFDGGVSLSRIDENGERVYRVVLENGQKDEIYSLCVVRGFHSTAGSFTQDDVIYYNVATGGENGCVFENVRPSENGSFTAYVINSRGTVTLVGTYREDFVPDVPDPLQPEEELDEPVSIIIGIVVGVFAIVVAVVLAIAVRKYIF